MKLPKRFSDRPEAGETLIEVLMSSALLGIVVLAIVGGIVTMVLGSAIHRDQSESNADLISAMEQLKSPAVARLCDDGDADSLPNYSLPPNVTIDKIWYQTILDPPTGNAFDWSESPSACSLTSPLTLQRITLKYTHPDSTNVEPELQFIKGDY